MTVKEFRPTIFFLLKFVGLYLVGNLVYGAYITSYHPRPDPVTHAVSIQTSGVLQAMGWSVTAADDPYKATTLLAYHEQDILAVYEGCNGINIMIIFVAFLLAFGPYKRALLWFVPLGLVIIHGMNLARIAGLFFVSRFLPGLNYFTHKYLFTAFLYVVIFVLWLYWIRKFGGRQSRTSHA
jgi:exosortase family protein XrtF